MAGEICSHPAYYHESTKQRDKDKGSVAAVIAAHQEHPFYGVEQLAIHLGWSEARTRRIRNLAGVVVPTAGKKYRSRKGGKPEIPEPTNALAWTTVA